MVLKGQDLVLCLLLCGQEQADWTYSQLAARLGLSVGGTHLATQRALEAGLLMDCPDEGGKPIPRRRALLEFLEHGVAVAFHVQPGRVVRGLLTAHSAPPLDGLIAASASELPLVWPDAEGQVRGRAVTPLYKSVPTIARRDARLYELLALVDAIRCGSSREQKLARSELRRRLVDVGGA